MSNLVPEPSEIENLTPEWGLLKPWIFQRHYPGYTAELWRAFCGVLVLPLGEKRPHGLTTKGISCAPREELIVPIKTTC